ncbi:hypothetical protein A3735_27125 [Oleiphilus sp. HI0061]|uniref:hypothetical protein n=1 Tax=Oleiphilus sp. HI0061 TaxID=1822239 RepID=UPI0007CFA336|nr:hypothetical protein [Oleiphilus sp. HI0061]KZY62517.1 hypothetical protein A3735_27200 [Oleiphilus sp. HI0061]KZY62528.1 hypothetical protein A3735_27125 [Oleiphilus sp. HI0061]
MKTSTLFFSQLRYTKNQKHQLNRSGEHTFLRKAKNVNPELSHLNKYYLYDNEIRAEEAYRYLINYKNKLSKDDEAERNLKAKRAERRVALKRKFKKWAESDKSSDHEKRLYKNIITRLSDEKHINKASILFEKVDDKIARYNDKKRAIEELEQLQNEILISGKNKSSGFNINVVEKLFKIPEENDIALSCKDQVELYEDYHKVHFSEYPIFLKALHFDELREHPHVYHSAVNSVNGLADYADAEIRLLRHTRPDLNLSSDQYSKLTPEEREISGRALQEHFYVYANMWLKWHGHDFQFKLKYEDEDPDLKAKNKYMRMDNKKPIGQRKYNQFTYLSEQNKKLEKEEQQRKERINKLKQIEKRLKAGFEAGQLYLKSLAQGLNEIVEKYRNKAVTNYVKATLESNSKTVAKRSIEELKALDKASSKLSSSDKRKLVNSFKFHIKSKRKNKYRR